MDRTLLRIGLRGRRTSLRSKTLLATSASRRDAFAAAVQQFEELMAASAAVGPASRPITLYYATVQAGLAVAAAHKTDQWSFHRHGLKLHDIRPSIADITVGPEGTGAFQVVAQATGSPLLHAPVTLGALWSSLPDLKDMPLPASSASSALDIHPNSAWSRVGARLIMTDENPGQENFKQHLTKLLPAYPGIEGFSVVDGSYEEIRESRWVAEIRWNRRVDFDEVAPAYRYVEERFLRPSLDDQSGRPPSALMTWWAILYTFSMLSRYRPREWAAALDIDKSRAAHRLEYCLDLALDVLPHLVLEALDGEPMLLAKPMAF
ncbi:hypothetical protein Vqi01_58960 [Micromonospora qiuiae]|uniref:YaaC-like Protein n=1 Tax=Micromonospora qiuiae TaxID=502268 RepID=A0ABQ4JMK3_9ACTN|nr:hypothetical protein [Micromonospora qiuiae]GIJ30734.1 hypothetical protein Vqi01_58960 [Micromonospora qiuiae]